MTPCGDGIFCIYRCFAIGNTRPLPLLGGRYNVEAGERGDEFLAEGLGLGLVFEVEDATS
jgi:hypothetical protein